MTLLIAFCIVYALAAMLVFALFYGEVGAVEAAAGAMFWPVVMVSVILLLLWENWRERHPRRL